MDVGAGVADGFHSDFLRDLEALHPGDEGGAEAVEALPGLLAPAGGGVAGIDADGLDELDEECAWASRTASICLSPLFSFSNFFSRRTSGLVIIPSYFFQR